MKLNNNEIRIFYRFDDCVDESLDLALIECLESRAFEYSASRCSIENQIRELVFEKKQ